MYKTPTEISVNWSEVFSPNKVISPVIGITAKAMKHVVALMIGAIINTILSAAAGIKSSFRASFTPSANPCKTPNFPTRFGPRRICMRATSRRSPHTAMIVETTQITKIITAFRITIESGSSRIISLIFLYAPSLHRH